MEGPLKTQKNQQSTLNSFSNISFDQLNIQSLIKQLKQNSDISKDNLLHLINTSQHIFQNQPNLLKLTSPIKVIGDIHGQFYDLLHIFDKFGSLENNQYLFLGDYVDRGFFCIQVMALLLTLKCKYPHNIYMLRGNHEGKTMTQNFNFKLQCAKKYDIDIYQRFLELFCKLPLCAIVDQKYFCVHGGISPELKKIAQLQKINRFKEIENSGLICDLLWSDPSNSSNLIWEKNKVRSCSYFYSKKQAEKFVQENKIEMIIRGHEVQTQGYSYQLSEYRKKLTLTIFSAPNYCDTYKNKGGVLIIKKGGLHIQCINQSPHPFIFPNYADLFQWSFPVIATNCSKMFVHMLKQMTQKYQDRPLTQEQLQTLNKIQCFNKLLEGKKNLNFELLTNREQLEIQEGKQSEYQCQFTMKKTTDLCQKYPSSQQFVIGPKHLKFNKIQIVTQKIQIQIDPIETQDFYC